MPQREEQRDAFVAMPTWSVNSEVLQSWMCPSWKLKKKKNMRSLQKCAKWLIIVFLVAIIAAS